jgi:hypothetical protein
VAGVHVHVALVAAVALVRMWVSRLGTSVDDSLHGIFLSRSRDDGVDM